jgi:hypothetical protein
MRMADNIHAVMPPDRNLSLKQGSQEISILEFKKKTGQLKIILQ